MPNSFVPMRHHQRIFLETSTWGNEIRKQIREHMLCIGMVIERSVQATPLVSVGAVSSMPHCANEAPMRSAISKCLNLCSPMEFVSYVYFDQRLVTTPANASMQNTPMFLDSKWEGIVPRWNNI